MGMYRWHIGMLIAKKAGTKFKYIIIQSIGLISWQKIRQYIGYYIPVLSKPNARKEDDVTNGRDTYLGNVLINLDGISMDSKIDILHKFFKRGG